MNKVDIGFDVRGTTNKALTPTKLGKSNAEKIAVLGLGYVGLPLANQLAKHFTDVVGFDISSGRVSELQDGHDQTGEVASDDLLFSSLRLSNATSDLAQATFYIVTVPTPITAAHQPDLEPLRAACRMLAPHIKKDDVIVFESTVYPGVTEDVCGPLLADLSGLRLGVDFKLGYSPERINPGDKVNTITNVTKVVSGQDTETLERVARVYERTITAGVHRAPSIKVAEAAKVLENTQRDVNIALMNEVSLICDKLNIRTQDVIDTAGTKWNFLKFQPGLVGGHCIGVDPYYLASLADQLGQHPEVILAGRRINDGMVDHVVQNAMRLMIQSGQTPQSARIGVFGVSFKEDVPDIRNSKSVAVVEGLRAYGLDPLVHDPHCDPKHAEMAGLQLTDLDQMVDLDLMIIACPHRVYRQQIGFLKRIRASGAIVDVKGAFAQHAIAKSRPYWSL